VSTDYVFFDAGLRDRFVQFVAARQIACRAHLDEMDGLIVGLPDDLPDALAGAIEAEYESLMNEQMLSAESNEGWVTNRVAGVTVTRADGRACLIRLPAPIARTLLEHFTPGDVQALVSAIAQGIESPVDGPLCRKV
jgi:hypothetical protein